MVGKSDRNTGGATPDTITQPTRATDANGVATGRVTTRRQGVAHISDDTADVDTPTPAAVTFQAADWESRFFMTAYIIAIDVFRGFGRASMQGWGNFHGTVRYLSGGGTCN